MRHWEKVLFAFFMGLIFLIFLWAIMVVDRANNPGPKELREARTTESISIGRVSRED